MSTASPVLFGSEFEDKTDPVQAIAMEFSGVYEGWERDHVSSLTDEQIAEELQGAEIVCAFYEYESYEGSAFILFVKDGKPYEVNASHCSCYGMEGQWAPEETSWEALAMRKWDSEPYGEAVKAAIAERLS